MSDDALQQRIRLLWQKNKATTRDRIATLERAAEELSTTRSLEQSTRDSAIEDAHKLAGSLGMFGYMHATETAREMEVLLMHEGLPQPERLEALVNALRDEMRGPLTDD